MPAVAQQCRPKKKERFGTLLSLLSAARWGGHTSNIAGSSLGSTADDIVYRSAWGEAIYGSIGLLLFVGSFVYDCFGERAAQLGKRKIVEGNLSGKKLQHLISQVLSLVGAIILLTVMVDPVDQRNNHLVIAAGVFLAFSGVISGSEPNRIPGAIGRRFQDADSSESEPRATVPARVTEPYADEGMEERSDAESPVVSSPRLFSAAERTAQEAFTQQHSATRVVRVEEIPSPTSRTAVSANSVPSLQATHH